MTASPISIFSDFFNPARLVGPVFDKELRVSSRRRRNYLLRFGYVIILSLFILSVWYSAFGTRSSGSALYRISMLSKVGRNVTIAFVWFQFVVAQLIAIVMLSSSMSDEIRTGTLSVLMTTPVNSIQIVIGKLLSKLLQLMLLLAISLPLLSIVRVFGGVPWDYVISSFCITLTAAVFAGALSLLLSMTYRYAYSVILVTIVGYMLIFGALPGFFTWLVVKGTFSQTGAHCVFALINPFWAVAATTQQMLVPSVRIVSWPIHCLIMFGATAVLLAIAVRRVRRVALCEAFGGPQERWSLLAPRAKRPSDVDNTALLLAQTKQRLTSAGPVRRVTGSPIVWKEMHKGFLGRSKTDSTISVLLIGCFLLTAILFLFSPRGNIIFPYYLMLGFYLIVVIRLAVSTAGSIAGEKEARTLPILLVTPLGDSEIIRGKIIAALWRNIPMLALYFFLLCIFCYGVRVPMVPYTLVRLVIAACGLACSVLFLVGSGSYFGVRLRTSTVAIAATVGSYLAITRLFCGMFNPLRILLFRRLTHNGTNRLVLTLVSSATEIIPALALGGVGLFLAWRAVRRLRHDIF